VNFRIKHRFKFIYCVVFRYTAQQAEAVKWEKVTQSVMPSSKMDGQSTRSRSRSSIGREQREYGKRDGEVKIRMEGFRPITWKIGHQCDKEAVNVMRRKGLFNRKIFMALGTKCNI
jgi:hypothetical protein